MRAPLIVRDPNAPYASKISKEYILTVSEWYHEEMPYLINAYQSTSNVNGTEPVPWAGLINDASTDMFDLTPGETYLFRILNIGSFPSFFVGFEGHNMTIVEMDSIYTQETVATTLYVGAAQRYSVLITANADPSRNYGIISAVDTTMFKTPSPNPEFRNATFATLSYNSNKTPAAPFPPVMPPIDDITVLPLDNEPLLGPVDKQIVLDFNFTHIDGVQRAIVNQVTYLPQKTPTLYTALSVGEGNVTDASNYGQVNPIFAEYGQVIEIVLNNHDNNGHPWHLHGHQFQTVARSMGNVLPAETYNESQAAPVPMRRDVAGVRGGGYTVFRFKADNPGVQFLHCHIEWHIEAGLIVTLLEAPELLYGGTSPDGKVWEPLVIPEDHLAACKKGGMPTAGSAPELGPNTSVNPNNWGAIWTPPTSTSGAQGGYPGAPGPNNGPGSSPYSIPGNGTGSGVAPSGTGVAVGPTKTGGSVASPTITEFPGAAGKLQVSGLSVAALVGLVAYLL